MKFEIKAGSEEFELKFEIDPTKTVRHVILGITLAIFLLVFASLVIGAKYGSYNAFNEIIGQFRVIAETIRGT